MCFQTLLWPRGHLFVNFHLLMLCQYLSRKVFLLFLLLTPHHPAIVSVMAQPILSQSPTASRDLPPSDRVPSY